MAGRMWRISEEGPPGGRWWVIREESLRRLLARAAAGEDPEFVLLEEYVNASRHEPVNPDDD